MLVPWLLAVALAEDRTTDDFADVVCVAQDGPPRGARAIARSPLGWAYAQRRAVYRGEPPVPGPELLEWLPVSVEVDPTEPVSARLSVAELPQELARTDLRSWVVVAEARAWPRPPVVAPNFTLVVDVSESMKTVHTRKLPVLLRGRDHLLFPPVTRMELTREVLGDLIERVPEDGKVSIVAFDGFNARVVVPPTLAFERELLRDGVRALEVGMVKPTDRPTEKVLEDTSARTFSACHDNRVLLLTDHVAELVQRQAIGRVRRWAADDVEIWSLGIGVTSDVNAQLALLGQAAGGAAWLVNSVSDGAEIWTHMLDPGGVVARDVRVRVDFPPGAEWRRLGPSEGAGDLEGYGPAGFELGTLASGASWSAVWQVTVPDDASPAMLRLAVTESSGGLAVGPAVGEVPPLAVADPALRTRAIAALWWARPDDRDVLGWRQVLPEVGHGTELRAWMAHASTHAPAP